MWFWLAATHRIVAWAPGCQRASTSRLLRQILSARYQQRTASYRHAQAVYADVSPRTAHRPSAEGSSETSIMESLNCSSRQRGGELVRKLRLFSKLPDMPYVQIQLWMDAHNQRLTKS